MTRATLSADIRDPDGGYVTHRPRASDAVGSSLRNIYEPDQPLPAEFVSLLRLMDAPQTH